MDTLLYTQKLESQGIPRKEAEAFVRMASEMVMNEVATKKDLELTEARLNQRSTELESKMDRGFSRIDAEFVSARAETALLAEKMEKSFARIQVQLMSTIIACSALVVGSMALFK